MAGPAHYMPRPGGGPIIIIIGRTKPGVPIPGHFQYPEALRWLRRLLPGPFRYIPWDLLVPPPIMEEEWVTNVGNGMVQCCDSGTSELFAGAVDYTYRWPTRLAWGPCQNDFLVCSTIGGGCGYGAGYSPSGFGRDASCQGAFYGGVEVWQQATAGGSQWRLNRTISTTDCGQPTVAGGHCPEILIPVVGYIPQVIPVPFRPRDFPSFPPDLLRPDLIPEIRPPTQPLLDKVPSPNYRDMPGTGYEPNPWSDPAYGTQRGPNPYDIQPLPYSDLMPGEIYWPVPDMIPIPVPQPAPQPAPRPRPLPKPLPRPNPLPLPAPAPGRGSTWPPRLAVKPIINRGPGVQTEIHPVAVSDPRLHLAGPRTKERKFIVAIPPGIRARIIGAITEGNDLIGCLHSALPKSMQAPKKRLGSKTYKPSIHRQAKAVYDAFLKPKALPANTLVNVILQCGWQQVMDRAHAAVGRAAGQAGRQLKQSTGFGIGGRGMRDLQNIDARAINLSSLARHQRIGARSPRF